MQCEDDVSTASQISTVELEAVRRQLNQLDLQLGPSKDTKSNSAVPASAQGSGDSAPSDGSPSAPPTTPIRPENPDSFYQLPELNADCSVRMARVPSQYQLDELSEVFIFDAPRFCRLRSVEGVGSPDAVDSSPTLQPPQTPSIVAQPRGFLSVGAVNSEYISQLLM